VADFTDFVQRFTSSYRGVNNPGLPSGTRPFSTAARGATEVTERDETPRVPGVSPEALRHRQVDTGDQKDIPQATVARLVIYLRVLGALADEGTQIVSSEELAAAAGVGSAKLRKDLSFLGPNGVRGVGYGVDRLRARIEGALGMGQGHRVVLIGIGNLGRALAGYGGFGRRGFGIVGLFDVDPDVIGTEVAGLEVHDVYDLKSECADLEPTIGVIAVPDDAAQEVCDQLVAAGVRRVLSFAQVSAPAVDQVDIRRVDLAVELQLLSFISARNSQQSGRSAPERSLSSPTGAAPATKGAVATP
jgi:redox-sensing transcriptional repressor